MLHDNHFVTSDENHSAYSPFRYCTDCRPLNITFKYEHSSQNTVLLIPDFEPLFLKHGVDVYLAGHWHYYESLWPLKSPPPGGAVPAGCRSYQNATAGYPNVTTVGCTTQMSFENPTATVHITSGNGGPPGLDNFGEDCGHGGDISCHTINATRKQSQNFGYGRLIAYNSSTLRYQQVANKDGSLDDEFLITQDNHGRFPPQSEW